MWYLIIPPVIVVASLAFVLWYLSRKGADPEIAEKMAQMDTVPKSPAFSRTKTFFLRILEKLVQRFKVGSLQMHNSLHAWTQSIKERRRKVQEAVSVANKHREEEQLLPENAQEKRFAFLRKRAVPAAEPQRSVTEEEVLGEGAPQEESEPSRESVLVEPIVRRRRVFGEKESVPKTKPAEPQPMVSARLTRPEASQPPKKPRNVLREEDLIKRIATNPKDFTAYEALGDYYLETNNITDAKECYRQVLKLSPVQRMVKIKIRRLEKLLSQKASV